MTSSIMRFEYLASMTLSSFYLHLIQDCQLLEFIVPGRGRFNSREDIGGAFEFV